MKIIREKKENLKLQKMHLVLQVKRTSLKTRMIEKG
jgi:hypothetical protein